MKKRRTLSVLLVVCMLLMIFPVGAFAADDVVIPIGTAEELMEILGETDANATKDKTYQLTTDLIIDTSTLTTRFNENADDARHFSGVLDGAGHTITVDTPRGGGTTQPLFDDIYGAGSRQAGIQNLNVVFRGDVAGATLAATFGNAKFSRVEISFAGDILFAVSTAKGVAIAAGVAGVFHHSGKVEFEQVTVTAAGDDQHGIIGSRDQVQKQRYVVAAGVYSDIDAAGADVYLNGVTIDVGGIYARTDVVDGQVGKSVAACCAAGAVGGIDQYSPHVRDVAVKVRENISAQSQSGSTADVDAYGLAYRVKAFYGVSVDVGGNIEALSYGYDAAGGKVEYSMGYTTTTSAVGMCYITNTRDNKQTQDQGIGECSVHVGGSITARSQGQGTYPYKTVASGYTWLENWYEPCADMTVQVDGDILSENDGGKFGAIAVGFSCETSGAYPSGEEVDRKNISVTARDIAARASAGDAVAAGFSYFDYFVSQDCSVTAQNITAETASSGEEACSYAAGFSFYVITYRNDQTTAAGNCQVTVESVTARGKGSGDQAESVAAGFACASNAYSSENYWLRNNRVTIGKDLSGETQTGLLVAQNFKNSYGFENNTVSLPRDAAEIVTLGETEYVRFTAQEEAGRAAQSADSDLSNDWERTNRVVFPGHSDNVVSCAFDSGDDSGTLWKLSMQTRYFSVSYDLNGGTAHGDADYDSETLVAGTEVTVKAAPQREGYTFTGWKDGDQLYQAGDTFSLNADVILTAQWQEDVIHCVLTYAGEGVERQEQYEKGTEVTLDWVPSREGYRFLGWFLDEACSQKTQTVVMDKDKTVWAGWEKSEVPEPLEGGEALCLHHRI